ncbi:ead/Ea22-like family protein [Citrobacter freundii]|uniref:ead/Ea22-like family protein n=1 Tax=Citrobacter freundii TaxID=546 RepID=UPI00335DA30F
MTALNKQAHKTENERMAQSLAERNGEPVEGLRQRISELEEIATDYGMKFQKAQDALKHQSLLHKSQMEAADKQIADLFKENVRLKSGIAGLVHLGIRHGDIEVMRIAGDAQMATPCTDSIIEKIAAGIGVKGE